MRNMILAALLIGTVGCMNAAAASSSPRGNEITVVMTDVEGSRDGALTVQAHKVRFDQLATTILDALCKHDGGKMTYSFDKTVAEQVVSLHMDKERSGSAILRALTKCGQCDMRVGRQDGVEHVTFIPKHESQSTGTNGDDSASPESVVRQVLSLALQKDYDALSKHCSWSWNSFHGKRDPDSVWRRMHAAGSLDNVSILGTEKSECHKDLFETHLSFTDAKTGRKAGKSLLLVRENGSYRLAVQANGSKIGNADICLGYSKERAEKTLALVGIEKLSATNTGDLYALDANYQLKLSYGTDSAQVASIAVSRKGLDSKYDIEAYLVVFDAEGNYTIKLISDKLVVQAKGKKGRKTYVCLGYTKERAEKKLALVGIEKLSETDTSDLYALDANHQLKLSYGTDSAQVASIAVSRRGLDSKYDIEAYLIVFDAEGSYTIKFISG